MMDELITKILEYTLVGTVSFVVYLNKRITVLELKCEVQDNEIKHLNQKICEVQNENRSCKNFERSNRDISVDINK